MSDSITIKEIFRGSDVYFASVDVGGSEILLTFHAAPSSEMIMEAVAKYPYISQTSKLSPLVHPAANISLDDEFDNEDLLAHRGWSTPDGTKIYLGGVDIGFHEYYYTVVTAAGESLPSPLLDADGSKVSCTELASQVALTIPVGPTGTTSRKVYRTPANMWGAANSKLCQTIADNSTTDPVDVAADADLTDAPPTVDTSGLDDTVDVFVGGVPIVGAGAVLTERATTQLFPSSTENGLLKVINSHSAAVVGFMSRAIPDHTAADDVVDFKAVGVEDLPDGGEFGIAMLNDLGTGVLFRITYDSATGVSVTMDEVTTWTPTPGTPIVAPGMPKFIRLYRLTSGDIIPAYSLNGITWSIGAAAAFTNTAVLANAVLYFNIPAPLDAGLPETAQVLLSAVRVSVIPAP